MSKIDYQKLREIAEKTKIAGEAPVMPFDQRINALNDFMKHFSPDIALALLDERERNLQYIKSRDQENEDIALTVGRLLIENGQLVADTLRHLADNEIDSDYFAITSTNENGTEIDHEMAITDYALQAAGTVDELVAALESSEKRIAELEAREVVLPRAHDVHPLGPQSAKIFCEFHRSIVNRCADEIRKVGVKVSIKGN
ncbi:ead/Ea22-like family protein [Escherichia coli]|nr:ead/Ea22-like family protein [Escherichia coli]MDS1726724.1 ead/Ea22-like family protein [Escherichia coli]HAW8052174.1 ead/Ea22-like family protein [Escherichia coli]